MVNVALPPQCEICERYCYKVFTSSIGPTQHLQYCFDCWIEWYDGHGHDNTLEHIKFNVLNRVGNFKGCSITEEEYEEYIY